MGAIAIQQMADRVAALMDERMGLGGQGLAAKLKRGGRRLPRRVRDAVARLAEAAEMAQNPKLLLQIDEERVAQDYDLALKHLMGISAWDRRIGFLGRLVVAVLVAVIASGALLVAVMSWRGLL
ncbi:MAG: hypothetical protein KF887_18045 [Paracoccaceae bacterium]|nr:MAG: hypothetical protein KF887_18045 [Paracoccaceae bacterium]